MSAVSDYVVSGFALIPIPTGLKGPTSKDWNKPERHCQVNSRRTNDTADLGIHTAAADAAFHSAMAADRKVRSVFRETR